MPVTLPTLSGQVPYAAEQAFRDLAACVNQLEQQLRGVKTSPAAAPPVTLVQIRQALGATGQTPLNTFQLIGNGSNAGVVTFGTHAQRVATPATRAGLGALYYETDHEALYTVEATGALAWALLAQTRPLPGTLSPDQKPADLGTTDVGFLFFSTDFWRVYVWTGVAWTDAPGEDDRQYYEDFEVAPGHAGWQLCDGSTVPRSKPDGTTVNVTVPDLVTGHRFRRANTVAGATGGNATAHTHTVTNSAAMQMAAVANNVVATQATSGPSGAGGDDALPPYRDMLPFFRL